MKPRKFVLLTGQMNTFVIFLIVCVAMLGRVSSFKRLGRPLQLTRVLRMSGGASAGEMAPFYSLGVNVARQVGSELKTILSKEEIDAMLEVSLKTHTIGLFWPKCKVDARAHLLLLPILTTSFPHLV